MNHITSTRSPQRLNGFLLKVGAENEDTGDGTVLIAQYNPHNKSNLQGLPLIRILSSDLAVFNNQCDDM